MLAKFYRHMHIFDPEGRLLGFVTAMCVEQNVLALYKLTLCSKSQKLHFSMTLEE